MLLTQQNSEDHILEGMRLLDKKSISSRELRTCIPQKNRFLSNVSFQEPNAISHESSDSVVLFMI
jgi:hypothetical protein